MKRFANNPFERRFEHNPYTENVEAQTVAAQYCQSLGFPEPQFTPYVQVNAATAKQIAEIYARTPNSPQDPAVQAAYAALINEVDAQYAILPVEIVPVDTHSYPYKTSQDMMDDVLHNHRLAVFDGGDDHAILSREQNFKFRAVHDFFGHAAHGYAFGPRGEENAWVQHCKMFSPEARRAMTTETRGQNSWVNFGPYSHLPVTERPYAEQKVFILPWQYLSRPELLIAYQSYPGFFDTKDSTNNNRLRTPNPLDEEFRPARGKAKEHFLFDAGSLPRDEKVGTWCRDRKRVNYLKKFYAHGREQFPKSHLWYDNTRANLMYYFRNDEQRTNFFILLLAATSPLESVESNIDLAFRAMKLYDRVGADKAEFQRAFPLQAHFDNVWRVVNGEPLSGPKVVSFARNLLGDADAVTVDRWIIRAMLGEREFMSADDLGSDATPEERQQFKKDKANAERITISNYRCIRDLIQKLAAQEGIEPRQYQAAAWAGVKDLRGNIEEDPPYPFEYYLDKYMEKEPMLSFEASPEEQEFAEFERALASNPGGRDPLTDTGGGEFVLRYDPAMIGL